METAAWHPYTVLYVLSAFLSSLQPSISPALAHSSPPIPPSRGGCWVSSRSTRPRSPHHALLTISIHSQGRLLGIRTLFTPEVAAVAVSLSGACDAAVAVQAPRIFDVLRSEESTFRWVAWRCGWMGESGGCDVSLAFRGARGWVVSGGARQRGGGIRCSHLMVELRWRRGGCHYSACPPMCCGSAANLCCLL